MDFDPRYALWSPVVTLRSHCWRFAQRLMLCPYTMQESYRFTSMGAWHYITFRFSSARCVCHWSGLAVWINELICIVGFAVYCRPLAVTLNLHDASLSSKSFVVASDKIFRRFDSVLYSVACSILCSALYNACARIDVCMCFVRNKLWMNERR